jgi:hypothetical protein
VTRQGRLTTNLEAESQSQEREREEGAREVLARHVHTAEPRGGPGGGAKDPTDDPAELDVLF